MNNTGNTTQLLTSFNALDVAQQKVLLSSKLLTEEQKSQYATMVTLSSVNSKYTAEQLTRVAGVSAETLANWGLVDSTDSLTIAELAELAVSDKQAKNVLDKIIAQNAQAVANGEVTASNIALASSEGGATLATGTFTTAIKANISAMKTWLLTTPAGWITAAVGVIFLAVKAYDAFTTSVEEQKEKMEESLSAYEDAKSELSGITTELENQEQAMNELLAKEKLTYAEKGQLEELQAITRELRIQKDLAEKEEDRTEKQLAKDATDLFNKQFGDYEISEYAINKYQNEDNNAILISDENDISAMIAGYKQFNELLDEAYGSGTQDDIDHFKSLTEDLEDSIFTTAQELQTQQDNISAYYESIKNTPYEDLTTEQKEIVDTYNAISNAIALIYQQLDPNTWNSMQVDNIFSTEGIEKTKDELVAMAQSGELTPETINGYTNLNNALGETTLSAQDLCDELYAIADAQEEVQGQNPDTPPILSLGISETVDALNTKLKPAMDSLASAYQDIFTEDGFTLDNVGVDMLDSIKSTIDELNDEKGLNLGIDYSAFEKFAQVLSDTSSTSEQVHAQFDNLASSLVYATDSAELSSENFTVLSKSLTEMGLVNADEVLTNIKNAQEEILAQGYDLANITLEQAKAFIEEGEASAIAAEYLQMYMVRKYLAEQPMNISGDIKALELLCNALGTTGELMETIVHLKNLLSASEHGGIGSQLQGEIENARAKIAELANGKGGSFEFDFDFSPATKSAKKAGKDAGEEYKKALEQELSDLDDVLSGITNIIGDQIDVWQENKESAVDALEAQKQAAEDALEAEKKLLEEQKEILQDKIDAKEKEIDAIEEARKQRQLEMDLQRAEYQLQKMLNQRTKLIYSDDKGFHYETDTSEVRSSREEIESIKEDMKIASIEREIDALESEIDKLDDLIDSIDDQIEASNKYYDSLIASTEQYYDNLIKNLEDYKSRWEELGDLEDQAKFEAKLKELGITTTDVLNMSDSAFQTFKESYAQLLAEINQDNDGMLASLSELTGIDFTPLGESIDGVSGKFGEVANSACDAANAISGVGGGGTTTNASSNQDGASSEGGSTSLKSAVEEQTNDAIEKLDEQIQKFSGEEESLTSAVQQVITKVVGDGEEQEGDEPDATNLKGAINAQYKVAEEVLPQEKTLFDELLSSISACVSELNSLALALEGISEIGLSTSVIGLSSIVPHAEGTVGKAFAKGTGNYKGLPHNEKHALVSEYGQPELTVYPNGDVRLTTEPTMSELPKDTVIFNEEQTRRIMNNKGTVLGNAYTNGTTPVIQTPTNLPSYLRPLQEGDKMYDLIKKFDAHNELIQSQIMPPVNAIQKNTEMMARNISNVNTNNNQRSIEINMGDVVCKGVTAQEVAGEIGSALKRELGGMYQSATQMAYTTR